MTKFQHKLIMLYEFKQLGKKMTPLRKFIWSIGLDYRDMTQKQVDDWARTKQYKQYKQRNKIKSIIKHAQVEESIGTSLNKIAVPSVWASKKQQIHRRAKQKVKNQTLDALNHGGRELSGEGSPLFKTKKGIMHSQRVIGSNKAVVQNRKYSSTTGKYYYAHKAMRKPVL